MDEVHAIRDSIKADMVCLLVGSTAGGFCGFAYVMQSVSSSFESLCFSVCAIPCISNQTFAHELGHNMGCAHDVDNAGARAYPYSYGWRWTGNSSTVWRSVMAYAPGSRIQYFSNPNVSYDGIPTGVQNSADNARTITNTAYTVANFRQRGTPEGPTLSAAPDPINISASAGADETMIVFLGNSGTETVNYTLAENAPWATISPLNGTATGAGTLNEHTLALDIDSLPPGEYSAELTMTDPGAVNSPKVIPIVMNIVQRPSNDNFASAQVISSAAGSVSGTTDQATRETGEPSTIAGSAGSHSIWYMWTAQGPSEVEFTTAGSSFDTLLGAYTGSLGSLNMVAQNDDGSGLGFQSRVILTPSSGTTYYILVDGWGGSAGTVQLNWSSGSAVSNWTIY